MGITDKGILCWDHMYGSSVGVTGKGILLGYG